MNEIAKVKPLSDAISGPIIKAYTAGGLGLVFCFLGTVLLLIPLVSEKGVLGYVAGISGSVMILTVLILFHFQDIKKLGGAPIQKRKIYQLFRHCCKQE